MRGQYSFWQHSKQALSIYNDDIPSSAFSCIIIIITIIYSYELYKVTRMSKGVDEVATNPRPPPPLPPFFGMLLKCCIEIQQL